MSEDIHLGTGEYEPQKYWEARAKSSRGNVYQAVCAFGRSDVENAAMEKVQAALFTSVLKSIDLRNSNVMELGCGVGRWAPLILKSGASYVGVDISGSMIEIARKRVPNGLFYKLDSDKLPFPDGHFDLVFSITVLHHNSFEQQSRMIDEMVRVTRPGGNLLLMEAVAREMRRVYFNTFARPIHNWVSEVERDGRADLVKVKVARWWLLRDVLSRMFQPAKKLVNKTPGAQHVRLEPMKSMVRNLIVRIDAAIDIYLMWLLPKRFATHAAMLFKKR
ncbi:class I SAM-dependent methyltransferase [Calderihabitans maritimus]|nr:class I SAM-dependent methyltransferase [Calderihabitans maritimus]